MKVVHLTVVRQLTAGQTKQLQFEYAAAKKLEGAEWVTLAYHNGPLTEPYMRQIPFGFRSLFMRKLWGWIVALRLSRSYDFVMMRHATFDPFTFIFAPLIGNRVSVHHAKELEELRLIRQGWKGEAAALFEQISGRVAIRRAKMILGVTQEIAEYERDRCAPGKKIGVYSNGIDVAEVPILADKRKPGQLHIVFICGTFSKWHGLDKLIDAVDKHHFSADDPSLTIHLIGRLSQQQIEQVSVFENCRSVFKHYGLLDTNSYRPILEECDFGVASLALDREGLSEGSTLKVREMLAMGLPVYSGHKDIALDESQSFIRVTSHPVLSEILEFGKLCKKINRFEVRESTKELIDKKNSMSSVVNFLFEARTKSVDGSSLIE
jgi:glycosyltransferase involved in cell wall biosynthesis